MFLIRREFEESNLEKNVKLNKLKDKKQESFFLF